MAMFTDSARTALAETFSPFSVLESMAPGARAPIPLGVIDGRVLFEYRLPALKLVTLTPEIEARSGTRPGVASRRDVSESVLVADWAYTEGFDGILYPSKYLVDGQLGAIFGPAGTPITFDWRQQTRLARSDLEAALSTSEVRSDTPGAPRVFVSYSWDSPEHQLWVREVFVAGLRRRGVDAVMDAHELLPGANVTRFMRSSIQRADHIAVICTPNYARRAEAGTGGVGEEAVLIRQLLPNLRPAQRVVPVLRGGTANEAVPPMLGQAMFVDARSDDDVALVLNELAAAFFGMPMTPAPPMAAPPTWLRPSKRGESDDA
ncbi:toll/interleukin-1 receptor domain-containing protein [Curtobacterium sp. MCPF17_051]|uniref:toll/interleukin-1 receptor domain-containing protein n=1 Tax=Curtobacterium sp. MCPF17_051 TaxID=2175640 RepID=UPI000DA82BA7|nr:toll/interleukin-1 receptor domain-containing protein [Curtobacterium sp. MCPF17_051]PZF32059.1 hypothetical protein DEJ35_05410 [Curtobacterium sp. MCPF17_051]